MLMSLVFRVLALVAMNGPCALSPLQDFLPGLVGPARGVGPWLVDGSDGRWAWARDTPTKSLWILKTTRERTVIRGHEVNSGSTTRFQHGGPDSPITDAMVVDDPWRDSVIPGGATWDLKNQYLFLTSQVYYPASGCYEFDVAVGARHGTITVEIK
jgi:hypothetical protein